MATYYIFKQKALLNEKLQKAKTVQTKQQSELALFQATFDTIQEELKELESVEKKYRLLEANIETAEDVTMGAQPPQKKPRLASPNTRQAGARRVKISYFNDYIQ